ncbi:glutamate ABC transporter substrate-binding protein, partial [Streptomyces sp. SID3343]|uniref:glutamate ABC transporter substrate-binding protein n=1 Tax=Streptomyces sp. SID3343 TaxID=2690260 RepID=UPI00136C79CC
ARRAAPGPDSTCPDVTKSLRPSGSLPAPTALPAGSTMRSIRDRGFLVAGIDQSTYPFGYVDPADNELRGFDVDLLRAVARAIFGNDDPSHLQFRVLPNQQRVTAVATGLVDIVAETMTINCKRKLSVDFSSVYFVAGQRILVQKDGTTEKVDYGNGLAGLPDGMRVCSVPGSTSIDELAAQVPKERIVEGDTWADCLVKLQQGQAEAITTDDTILAGLKTQDPYFTQVVGSPITYEPYGMAISKDRPDLVRFVNALLEQMRKDGTWQRLYRTYLGVSLGDTVPDPPSAEYRDPR